MEDSPRWSASVISPLIDDPRFREKLAAVEVELKALEMTQLRVVADGHKQREGDAEDPASSITEA